MLVTPYYMTMNFVWALLVSFTLCMENQVKQLWCLEDHYSKISNFHSFHYIFSCYVHKQSVNQILECPGKWDAVTIHMSAVDAAVWSLSARARVTHRAKQLAAQFGNLICYYIPRIRRIGGCYGFTSKPPAVRRPPPATRRPQWC